MARYQVLLTDRLGARHGEVPADALSYERRLGGGGSASVRIRLDHPVISGANLGALDSWATELLVLRDGVPQFNGPVITPDGDAVDGHVTVTAAAATQWLSRRFVLRDLAFTATEQADILTALVDYAQDPAEKGPNADFRLLTDAPATGVLRDRTFLGAERGQLSDLTQQLSEADGGFDLTLELDIVGTEVVRVLRAHYPAAGVDKDTPLVLGQGLTGLTVQRPGESIATRIYAVGNGEGSDQITAVALSDAAVEAAYGVHEVSLSATDIKEQATLQAQAEGVLAVRRPPVLVVGASYRVGEATPFGLAELGDRVQVLAQRGWLTLDTRVRTIARKVTVGPSNSETVDLTFNSVLGAA